MCPFSVFLVDAAITVDGAKPPGFAEKKLVPGTGSLGMALF
jgi:hypothetical protein